MRTLSRALAAVAATALVVPLWPVAAHADSATETASSTAYFSQTGIPRPQICLPAPPPSPVPACIELPQAPPQPLTGDAQFPGADGVGPGNLGVEGRASRETKVSFVYFSLSAIPAGSEITRAVMTVPLAPADAANRQEKAEPTNVRACAPDDSGFGGQDGLNIDEAPARKCDVFSADATATPDGKAFVFDISALAATWDEANDGVALTRTAKAEDFQAVFLPTATLDFEYTPPPDEDTGAEFDTGAGDAGVTTDVGSGDASFDTGSFGTDTGSTGLDTTTAPLVGGALSTAPQSPAVDQPAVAAAPSATSGPIELLSLTPGFWLGALLLLGALGFLALILGDRTGVASAASRPSRLARALSSPPGARPTLLGSRNA